MNKILIVTFQFIFLSQFPTLLQTSVLISPLWLSESDGTNRGLVNQQRKDAKTVDYSAGVLDATTLGLQIVATVLLWVHGITFITTAYLIVKHHVPGRRCLSFTLILFYLSIGMYIVSSFFMLAGCIRFGSIYPMEKISYAFFYNIAIFCSIWLVVLVFICDHICKKKRDENVFHTLVCRLRHYVDDI